MNKNIKRLCILIVMLLLVAGCKPGKKVKYEGKKLDIIFNVKHTNEFKLSQDKKDSRTAREEAILVSDNFKIGIEISEELSNDEYKGNFKKFKEKYKDKEDYKEVKYNKKKGFMIYSKPYARYEIYLPVDKKYIVRFNVYAFTNSKESTTKVLKSKEVKEIFKYLEIKVK